MSQLNTRVKINGAEKLIDQFENLKKKIQRKYLRAIVNEATINILKFAKAKCPRKSRKVTGPSGMLRKSLGRTVKVKKRKTVTVVGHVMPRKGFEIIDKNGNLHDPRRIAHIIEYGRKSVTVKDKKVLSDGSIFYGKKVAAVPAQPFMRPALEYGSNTTHSIGEMKIRDAITSNPNVSA